MPPVCSEEAVTVAPCVPQQPHQHTSLHVLCPDAHVRSRDFISGIAAQKQVSKLRAEAGSEQTSDYADTTVKSCPGVVPAELSVRISFLTFSDFS